MIKRLSIFLLAFMLVCSLNLKVFAAGDEVDVEDESQATSASADWDVSSELSLVGAIQKAVEKAKDEYPNAVPYYANLKFTKRFKGYEVKLKVKDNKCIKVKVSLSGKTKLYDKKGRFYKVSKTSIKDESLRGKKKRRSRRKHSKRRRRHKKSYSEE